MATIDCETSKIATKESKKYSKEQKITLFDLLRIAFDRLFEKSLKEKKKNIYI